MFLISEQSKNKCKEDLKSYGFGVLRNAISLDFLKKLENEVLNFSWGNIGKAEINVIETNQKCVLSSSHNLVNNLETFRDLYNSKIIKSLYLELIGNYPNTQNKINSSYFFKSKQSKEIKIHQDNAYFNLFDGIDCLTFYIPIHFQSKSNGTIFYYSGSHLLEDLDHVPEGNLGASMCLTKNRSLKEFDIKYLDLQPGDIVIHNAWVVHGTLANPNNVLCEAFNFTFFGETNKINEIKYNQYKSKLKKFLSEKATINKKNQ